MGGEVITHPKAATRAPNPRTVRAKWLAAVEAARADGAMKGLIIYEASDGGVGIAPTTDVSGAHTHGLLLAALRRLLEEADGDAG